MTAPPDKTPARIAGMFDAIAPRYDLLNHVLSAGLDRRWRDQAVDALALPEHARVLDLCTGTGDLAVATVRRARGATVVGIDFAGEMLRLGLVKVRAGALDGRITLVRGDAARIPLRSSSCDAATIGFGIRNVAEPERALAELARVLKPGARLAILEFGQPRIPGIRTLYSWYFRYMLPLVGRLISRHQSAYSYLPASVGTFPPPAEFSRILSATGFSQVRAVPLTFGIVYLFVGERTGPETELERNLTPIPIPIPTRTRTRTRTPTPTPTRTRTRTPTNANANAEPEPKPNPTQPNREPKTPT